MIGPLSISTKSMTSRLALFFTLVSVVICLLIFVVFYNTMKWAEDKVGEKRILLDAQVAIEHYQQGETGQLQIDFLTDAYDDFSLIPLKYLEHIHDELAWLDDDVTPSELSADEPESYLRYFHGNPSFLGEIGDSQGSGRMVYITEFDNNGRGQPLILITRIDTIELRPEELGGAIALISAVFSLLLTAFTLLLMRLSKRLISPINSLSEQLEECQGHPNKTFTINAEAAVEFTQLTNQLNQYREDINELLKREQIFARYSSHELRTPLTIVKGANDLLQRGEPNDFQARQIKRIKLATTQMANMIDALLGLVRYERDGDDTPTRTLKVRELEAIVYDHLPYLSHKSLEIKLTVDAEPEVKATEAVMMMLIGNLLQNAISASQNGIIELRMDGKSISVLDEGRGLEDQPFEEGHGLGLLLVKDLCLRYGWHFSLENREPKGCIASIRLLD